MSQPPAPVRLDQSAPGPSELPTPTGKGSACLSPQGRPSTIQDYIDQAPCWPDGTPAPGAPMTPMQWRIWFLATAGKFFEGLVIFATGVALPLIVDEFALSAAWKGAVGAAPLAGILVGATALGGLADRYGRKRMFVLEMFLLAACLSCLVASRDLPMLLTFLFGVGMALGCDYPTAHMVISESISSDNRGRLVLAAFGFQALGALAGTGIGYLILVENPDVGAWRWMYATAIVPALLVAAGRLTVPDSGPWLASRGLLDRAGRETLRLLDRTPPYPRSIEVRAHALPPQRTTGSGQGLSALLAPGHRRATILASVPWLLQDLGTYGIGLFTPTILAVVVGASPGAARNIADIVHKDLLAAKGAAFLDLLLLAGMVVAVLLVERAGRIRLQVAGFAGCALGLAMVAASREMHGAAGTAMLFGGFMVYNFMTNMGPNSMTYLIAGEVFPTRIRGLGMGAAASVGKVGAVATAFLFPVLLERIGLDALLMALVGTSLLGGTITWLFRIETSGVNLERLDQGGPENGAGRAPGA